MGAREPLISRKGLHGSSRTGRGWAPTSREAPAVHATAHLVRLDRPRLHVQVPDLDREIIPGEHVPAAVAELHVGHRGDDFGEEGAVTGVLGLLKDCRDRRTASLAAPRTASKHHATVPPARSPCGHAIIPQTGHQAPAGHQPRRSRRGNNRRCLLITDSEPGSVLSPFST